MALEAAAPSPEAGSLQAASHEGELRADPLDDHQLARREIADRAKTTRVVSSEVSVRTRLAEIWHSRELLANLIRTEIRVKYKNSFLGLVWSLISPAMTLGIYTLVFGVILNNGIPDFVLLLFSGLLAWNLFSTGVQAATAVIVNNAALVKKVSFPREILALACVGSAGVFFFFQACVLVIFLVGLHWAPAWSELWLLLVAALPLLVFSSALALLLAAVNVYLRDTQHLVEVLVGAAWFWACPIVYSFQQRVYPHLNPHHIVWLYLLNPLTPVVLTFERVIYAKQVVNSTIAPHLPMQILPGWGVLSYVEMDAIVLAASTVLFYVAMVVFGRLAGNFAEEL